MQARGSENQERRAQNARQALIITLRRRSARSVIRARLALPSSINASTGVTRHGDGRRGQKGNNTS